MISSEWVQYPVIYVIIVIAVAVILLLCWKVVRKSEDRRFARCSDLPVWSFSDALQQSWWSRYLWRHSTMPDMAHGGLWIVQRRHFEHVICAPFNMAAIFFSGSSLHMAYHRMPWQCIPKDRVIKKANIIMWRVMSTVSPGSVISAVMKLITRRLLCVIYTTSTHRHTDSETGDSH